MNKKQDSKINITYVNEELLKTNPALFTLDRKKFAHASILLSSDALAAYLVALQIDKRNLPLLNVGTNMLPIIPEINKKIITLAELAAYYMIDINSLYSTLELAAFDLSSVKKMLKELSNTRKKYMEISENIGPLTVHGNTGDYDFTLVELAELKNIPFAYLYIEFLNNDADINKTINSMEEQMRTKQQMEQLSKVIYAPMRITDELLNRYNRLSGQAVNVRKRYVMAMSKGAPFITLNNPSEVMKLFLTPLNSDSKEEMNSYQRMMFLQYVLCAYNKSTVSADVIRDILRLSALYKLPIETNTQIFNYLQRNSADKSYFIIDMIDSEIRKNNFSNEDPAVNDKLAEMKKDILKQLPA